MVTKDPRLAPNYFRFPVETVTTPYLSYQLSGYTKQLSMSHKKRLTSPNNELWLSSWPVQEFSLAAQPL